MSPDDETSPGAEHLRAVSGEAFGLAQRQAAGSLSDEDRARARQLADEVGSLQPVVDAASGHEQEGLRAALSEAFVDLHWVLNGGTGPASIRTSLAMPG